MREPEPEGGAERRAAASPRSRMRALREREKGTARELDRRDKDALAHWHRRQGGTEVEQAERRSRDRARKSARVAAETDAAGEQRRARRRAAYAERLGVEEQWAWVEAINRAASAPPRRYNCPLMWSALASWLANGNLPAEQPRGAYSVDGAECRAAQRAAWWPALTRVATASCPHAGPHSHACCVIRRGPNQKVSAREAKRLFDYV